MTKKKWNVPVYVFDEHSEAFYYWHKAKVEGLISEPIDLFHVDAHDDMGRAERFRRPLYFRNLPSEGYLPYYEDFARRELHIGNFVIPAVLSGLVRNVYFICPGWRSLKPRRKRLSVCSAFGEGTVLKYDIKPRKGLDRRVLKAYPDLKLFNYAVFDLDKLPRRKTVLLDIDLDYFACRDSISNHMVYELEITRDQFIGKDRILTDRSLPYASLDFSFIDRGGKYFARISYKREKEVAHLPSREEILKEITRLIQTLRAKETKPVVITMSRSCFSGYCPPDYSKFIERELRRGLSTLFRN